MQRSLCGILAALALTCVTATQTYSVQELPDGGVVARVNSTTSVFIKEGLNVTSYIGGDSRSTVSYGDDLNHKSTVRSFTVNGTVTAYTTVIASSRYIVPNGPEIESVCVCGDDVAPGQTGWIVRDEHTAIAGLLSASSTTQGCGGTTASVYTRVKFTAAQSVQLYSLSSRPNLFSFRNGTEQIQLGVGSVSSVNDGKSRVRIVDETPIDWNIDGRVFSSDEMFLLSLEDKSFNQPGWWFAKDGVVHLPSITSLASVLNMGTYDSCRANGHQQVVPMSFEGNLYGTPAHGQDSNTAVSVPVAATTLVEPQAIKAVIEEIYDVELSGRIGEVSSITKNGDTFTLHNDLSHDFAVCRANPCLQCDAFLVRLASTKHELQAPGLTGLSCNFGNLIRTSVDMTPAARMLRAESRELAVSPPEGRDFDGNETGSSGADFGTYMTNTMILLGIIVAVAAGLVGLFKFAKYMGWLPTPKVDGAAKSGKTTRKPASNSRPTQLDFSEFE